MFTIIYEALFMKGKLKNSKERNICKRETERCEDPKERHSLKDIISIREKCRALQL